LLAEAFGFLGADSFDCAKGVKIARGDVGDFSQDAVVEDHEGSPFELAGEFEAGGAEFFEALGCFSGEFAKFGGSLLFARAAGGWCIAFVSKLAGGYLFRGNDEGRCCRRGQRWSANAGT
jgi:hypothetical protein